MDIYSIIVPSYNQHQFIGETLENLSLLKTESFRNNIGIQIIVVDNCSEEPTLNIIKNYKHIIDELIIEKDNGQFDAINKGLKAVRGNYWTWLNTDDLIDLKGFFKLAECVRQDKRIDYIYGNNAYIDEHSRFIKNSSSGLITLEKLLNYDASISQPGSFFKTAFTEKVGPLAEYRFAFDYEYILRCLKNNAVFYRLEANVASFRYYSNSKSGSRDYRFLEEQLQICKLHGGRPSSRLNLMLRLRILKRRIFNG